MHKKQSRISVLKNPSISAQESQTKRKTYKTQVIKNPSTNAQESKHKHSRIQAQTFKNSSKNMQESKQKHAIIPAQTCKNPSTNMQESKQAQANLCTKAIKNLSTQEAQQKCSRIQAQAQASEQARQNPSICALKNPSTNPQKSKIFRLKIKTPLPGTYPTCDLLSFSVYCTGTVVVEKSDKRLNIFKTNMASLMPQLKIILMLLYCTLCTVCSIYVQKCTMQERLRKCLQFCSCACNNIPHCMHLHSIQNIKRFSQLVTNMLPCISLYMNPFLRHMLLRKKHNLHLSIIPVYFIVKMSLQILIYCEYSWSLFFECDAERIQQISNPFRDLKV